MEPLLTVVLRWDSTVGLCFWQEQIISEALSPSPKQPKLQDLDGRSLQILLPKEQLDELYVCNTIEDDNPVAKIFQDLSSILTDRIGNEIQEYCMMKCQNKLSISLYGIFLCRIVFICPRFSLINVFVVSVSQAAPTPKKTTTSPRQKHQRSTELSKGEVHCL